MKETKQEDPSDVFQAMHDGSHPEEPSSGPRPQRDPYSPASSMSRGVPLGPRAAVAATASLASSSRDFK